MDLLDILRCPTCRSTLAERPGTLRCQACDRDYEVIHGIPDFRPEPPDRPRHGDVCLRVIDLWETSTYRELWALYHDRDPSALGQLWDRHEAAAPERGERRWGQIVQAARAVGCQVTPDAAALDLGCGLGSALFALAPRATLAVGLDILLTDLLLAKKRFLEANIDNVALVCGSGLHLPFPDQSFAVANATDVVEHMPDQPRFLAEAERVLAAGGCFFFNSPNRYSLLSREPHVGLWGVGWLPRRWQEPYVQWRLGRPYRGKRLLSAFELRRLARGAFGDRHRIWSFLPRPGLGGAVLRLVGTLGRPILPQHNVLAWKPAD
ncbi:MAG: methyltransferase domain-containing protein [bacterium]